MPDLAYATDVAQQLKDLKRLIAYLMIRDGREKIRVPIWALDQIPDDAELVVCADPMSFELVVAVYGVPPVFGIDVVDAEIVDKPSPPPAGG